jgi:hypothetical protein
MQRTFLMPRKRVACLEGPVTAMSRTFNDLPRTPAEFSASLFLS